MFGPGRSRQEQSDRLEPVPAEHESLTLKNVQAAVCTCDLSWNAISGLAAPKVILTTIDDSPSSLIITSDLPPFQRGLARRIASTCLRIAASEASRERTNEKDVSDSAEVRVQLVNGLSRK